MCSDFEKNRIPWRQLHLCKLLSMSFLIPLFGQDAPTAQTSSCQCWYTADSRNELLDWKHHQEQCVIYLDPGNTPITGFLKCVMCSAIIFTHHRRTCLGNEKYMCLQIPKKVKNSERVQCYEPATMKYLGFFPVLKPEEVSFPESSLDMEMKRLFGNVSVFLLVCVCLLFYKVWYGVHPMIVETEQNLLS